MAFPTVARIRGQSSNDTTSHDVTFSGLGTVSAGDGLLVVIGIDGDGPITWPGGWTVLVNQASGAGGGQCRLGAAYTTASGGETGITVTTDPERAIWSVFKFATGTITPWASQPPTATALAQPNTTTPDPPSHTASWGSDDNWWLAAHACDSNRSTTAFPANTTDQFGDTTPSNGAGFAERYDTALATWDPTAFSISTVDECAACTIAVRPAAAGGPTPVITDAGDEVYTDGEVGVVVTGTDFETPQGTGKIELGDSATYGSATLVAQTVTAWGDTSITMDVVLGALTPGSLWLYVTNNSGNVSNAWPVTVNASGTFTPALGVWRWYSDDTPDGSMTALAAQGTKPVLTTTEMHNGIIRLRAQVVESGGASGGGVLTVDYSANGGTNWIPVERAFPNQAQEGSWFRYGDGAATEGATIGTQFLTGTNESGIYIEDNDQSISVGANATHELDIAIFVHWPTPDTDVRFRLKIGGTPITGTPPIELRTSTVADRTITIRRLEPDSGGGRNHEIRFSPWPRFFYDGTRWWAFTARGSNIEYQSWNGPGNNWSSIATVAMTGDMEGTRHAPAHNGSDKVYVINRSSSSTMRFRRGVISGTTITWDAEQSLTQSSDRFAHIAVDDGGYIWIAGNTASTGVWIRRSTNPDDVTSWQAVDNVAATGVASGDPIVVVGLASNRCLVCWYETGTDDLSSVVVNGPGSPGAVRQVSPAIFSDDWGIARDTVNSLVYISHTVGPAQEGQRKLSVLDEAGDTWAACPDPPETGSNTGINDGLPLTVHGNDVYYFGVYEASELGQDRKFEYRIYHGPGASGTWEGGDRVTLRPGNQVNLDFSNAAPRSAGGVILTGSMAGDPGVNDAFVPYSWEYYTIPVSTPPPSTALLSLLAEIA